MVLDKSCRRIPDKSNDQIILVQRVSREYQTTTRITDNKNT